MIASDKGKIKVLVVVSRGKIGPRKKNRIVVMLLPGPCTSTIPFGPHHHAYALAFTSLVAPCEDALLSAWLARKHL